MSEMFNPSRNASVNAQRGRHGYVATLVELPTANAKVYGYVVFCGEDKRFYECQHIVTETEDYYRWVAVTSGGQRTFFVPVERLTDEELKAAERPTPRTNCFDALASATDEIAIGLFRYNIRVEPLCYKSCSDTKYIAGKKYYVWYDSFDRAQYVKTKDTTAKADKTYYFINTNGDYQSCWFAEGTSLSGKTYYESTRPLFIQDPAYKAGDAIDHRVFVSNGVLFKDLTMQRVAAKLNEIIDAINITGSKLSKVLDLDTCTLFDLCTIVNTIIDELNPFSNAWNNLLNRVTALEQEVLKRGTKELPIEIPGYIKKGGITYSVDIDVTTSPISIVVKAVV